MLRDQRVEGMMVRTAGVGHRGRESYFGRKANTDRTRTESWSHTKNIRSGQDLKAHTDGSLTMNSVFCTLLLIQ